jgi:hypothetical protein
MSATPLRDLILYTRPGCGLCEEARTTLQGILEDRAARGDAIATVNEIDITTDPDLEARFFNIIPVVEMGGRRLDLAISPAKLLRFVADALDAATNRIA